MYCGFQILLNPFGDQILHHAIVSQKLQNTHTFVAKITIWISAHPNFVHFLGLLYISEKICTFHFLSQTGIGPLHCQSYARRSNMGKCHKLVLGLKFWSVYIFKSPLAATALSLFRTSGKGTDNITKFHMCSHWVWQPCEVMPFCKHIDDTRKSDSFNQVNELKSFGKCKWLPGMCP